MDGIVGIYGLGDKDLVNKTFLATGACQHRGKASTGLAIASQKGIYVHKGLGRIAEVNLSRSGTCRRYWKYRLHKKKNS